LKQVKGMGSSPLPEGQSSPDGDDLPSLKQVFLKCLTPSLSSLPDDLHRALRQLSIFQGGFDKEAAAAVLDVESTEAQEVLQRLFYLAMVEFGGKAPCSSLQQEYFLHYPVALCAPLEPGFDATLGGRELATRFVCHFADRLQRLSRACPASFPATTGSTLATLEQFDMIRPNVEIALELAGTSVVFPMLMEAGRVFLDYRYTAERRVYLFERLLGMALQDPKLQAGPESPKQPVASVGERARVFGTTHPTSSGSSGLGRTRSESPSASGIFRTSSVSAPTTPQWEEPLQCCWPCS
jgi:hypothetical protein